MKMALHYQSRSIAQLQKLAFSGNIEGLRAILSDWRAEHGSDELFIQNTAILLSEAVDRNSFEVAECLLDFQVPMNTDLFLKATRNTLYRILDVFLHYGLDINAPVDPFTPSALALSFHDQHLTEWFLAHGANPNQRCDKYRDFTPLSVAFREADFSIVKLLLDNGASLQQGQVLHYAAIRELDDRLDVLKYLLRDGLPVNYIMYQNCGDEYYFNMYSGIGTPLHYAAARGLRDSVEFLIESGASPQIKDPAGNLAMDWAEYNGHTNVAEFLRPFSVGHGLEPVPQFTCGGGRHFDTVPMEKFLKESGYQLV